MIGKRPKIKRLQGGKRTTQERERDFLLIADWYVQGLSAGRISELLSEHYQGERQDPEFSISRSQIQKDIDIIVGRWREDEVTKIASMKAIAGQRIEAMYREYWEAWIKSKAGTTEAETDAQVPKNDKKGGDDPKVQATRFKTMKTLPHGNIEFLRGAGQCIDQQIKLYGLAAPTKVAPTDPSGEKEYGANRMSEEERLQRLRELILLGQERQQQAESPTSQLLAQAAAYEVGEGVNTLETDSLNEELDEDFFEYDLDDEEGSDEG